MSGSQYLSRACAGAACMMVAGGLVWPGFTEAVSGVPTPGAIHADMPDAYIHPAPGSADQADAVQRALDGLQPGQRLVFTPGRYVVGRSLVVRQRHVVLSGFGATLVATDPGNQTIEMRGDGTTLVGFHLRGTGATRLDTPESTKVEVTGHDVQVLDNVIDGGASAGIFVYGGSDVAIVGNQVRSTLADGIHMTHGTRNVLVQGNVVRGTGDDMIAVVSYQADGALSGNVLVTGNSLEGNTWGRGITVVGGTEVTISNNIVHDVQVSAGILVAQEDSYRTYGASDVRVENNVISSIQTAVGRTDPRPLTQQAAIDVSTWSGSVTRVVVIGNRVSHARFAGIRVWGNVSQYRIADNRLSAIGGEAVQVGGGGGCTSGGTSAEQCRVAVMQPASIDVVGADTSALPHVREALRQARPPRRGID
ncbi:MULTISPECIES: right-handed parallel beta-helix repeat-containing protein [Burkholderia]|jgi:Right handed beta helix region|uniref:Right-handed parallel beta-helix repeat-containing protein n=5 Tax=Burkholderia TaxID=32008 RepID=A0A7Z0XFJ0_9BURK|nr:MULTISPECIES: right-handed parallel beta-helix repeat-containing protein [Burkholderia]UTP25437.1 right-handed parallel beta-helix repeat-containing protein [Burkholderia sp. FXe9]KKL32986.1 right handed beta helix region family protein [Burkholderia contaminans LMG 23361]MBA9827674.1 right-handed parallel beta-helix repeat-containing protein [Burkholderia contaminans]MBA9836315.1 right-handed parallel beta-helix repeat-containing protein [Burkholderia contaminans]MBA9860821.1 right-handed 